MTSLAAGDEGALRELVRRYEGPVYGFLSRHTGGRDVDDLYQETWIRVVRSAARFDPGKRFSTWLFQIAVNLCRDRARRATPEPTGLDGIELTARDSAEATDAALDARRLLRSLPEAHRSVLVLRYYHGFSEDEVAEMLDCPRGTIKSRLHYAIARLKELVRERPQ